LHDSGIFHSHRPPLKFEQVPDEGYYVTSTVVNLRLQCGVRSRFLGELIK
jgi:hypothetical protein